MKRLTTLLLALPILLLAACDSLLGESGTKGGSSRASDYEYPVTTDRARQQERGYLTGGNEGGFTLFGGSGSDEGGNSGIGVNGYLWRATLDTLSFMPLTSADPFGGVVITDWYENPGAPGERFKADALILTTGLRSDGIRVKLFKQQQDTAGQWRDVVVDTKLPRQLEDTILTRARELKIASGK